MGNRRIAKAIKRIIERMLICSIRSCDIVNRKFLRSFVPSPNFDTSFFSCNSSPSLQLLGLENTTWFMKNLSTVMHETSS